jgi:phosphoglycolate phosphatase
MNRPFDLVMFDLDGTLVDTAPEIRDALNDTLAEFGLGSVARDEVARWIGHGLQATLVSALARVGGGTPEAVRASARFASIAARYEQHYAARCGSSSLPYPGAIAVIERLRADGVHVAVLTNKEYRHAIAVLRVHGMLELFEHIVGGDTLPQRKPDPAGVHHCLAHFGVAPARAVLVGDSGIDARTARSAGIAGWLFPHGYNGGAPVEDAGADRVLADFAALGVALLPSTTDTV